MRERPTHVPIEEMEAGDVDEFIPKADAYMDQLEADLERQKDVSSLAVGFEDYLKAENTRLREAVRDVLDLFVRPQNHRERKAEKYLRAILKAMP